MKHHLRKSVRTIGETILVKIPPGHCHHIDDREKIEITASESNALVSHSENADDWREGTVAWVQHGHVKVKFRDVNDNTSYVNSNEHWLDNNDVFVLS